MFWLFVKLVLELPFVLSCMLSASRCLSFCGCAVVVRVSAACGCGRARALNPCVQQCVPYALAWGKSIVAAGNDKRGGYRPDTLFRAVGLPCCPCARPCLPTPTPPPPPHAHDFTRLPPHPHSPPSPQPNAVCFYDDEGNPERTFDYSGEADVKEFGCAVVSPSSVAVVVGNFNRFITYAFNSRLGEWEESKATVVPHLYNVTALGWKADGRYAILSSAVIGLCRRVAAWQNILCEHTGAPSPSPRMWQAVVKRMRCVRFCRSDSVGVCAAVWLLVPFAEVLTSTTPACESCASRAPTTSPMCPKARFGDAPARREVAPISCGVVPMRVCAEVEGVLSPLPRLTFIATPVAGDHHETFRWDPQCCEVKLRLRNHQTEHISGRVLRL
jgi:hypothetical protein